MSELTKLIMKMIEAEFTIEIRQSLNPEMLSLSIYHIPTDTETYRQISFDTLTLTKTDIIKDELERIYRQYTA